MELNLNLDKDAIEKAVTDAIIKSSIGDIIQSAIRERMQDFKLKDAIGKVIDQQIAVIVRDTLLKDDAKSAMTEAVKAHLTKDLISVIVGKACDKIWN